jgi:hypothetical protein
LLNGWLHWKAVLRRMILVINVNKNWRKRYNVELMQIFGGLDALPFVRIRLLN